MSDPSNHDDENGKAIPLISIQNNKIQLHQESIEALCKSEYKFIGIISLVGKYRTGKSFLLNRILLDNKNKGFKVGATIRPCTKGIWMWSKPIEVTNENFDEKFHVFFIDTEGLDAYDEEINHDSKIFLLAILISSLFIFNSFNAIDENAINSLTFVLNLSSTIKINRKDAKAKPEDLAKYFPRFLWILRDFSLKLEDPDGNPITSNQYLENALSLLKGNLESVKEKNKLREMINLYFPIRDCFTLVRPVESEEELQNLMNISDQVFRPEFNEQSHELKKNVFKKVSPKLLHGKVLSGKMIVDYISSLVNSINQGDLPVIENSWNYIIQNEISKYAEIAIKNYSNQLSKFKESNFKNPNFQEVLKVFNKQTINNTIREFKNNIIDSSNENHLDYLSKKLNEEFLRFNELNNRFFEKNLKELLEEQDKEILKFMQSSKYIKNHYEFFNDIEIQIDQANKSIPDIPIKTEMIYNKKFSIVKKFIEEIHIKEKDNLNREIIKLNNEIKKYESKAHILNSEIEQINEDNKKQSKLLTEKLIQLKTENRALETKIKSYEENKILTLQNSDNLHEKLTTDYEKKIKGLDQELISLQSEIKKKDDQIYKMQLDREKLKDLSERNKDFISKSILDSKENLKNKFELKDNDGKSIVENESNLKIKVNEHINFSKEMILKANKVIYLIVFRI